MRTYTENSLVRLVEIVGDKKKGIEPIIPISESTFLRGVKNGVFPERYKIGSKAVVWKYGELMQAVNNGGVL